MKKRFLVMAMAGLALAGCVSEDVAEVKQKDEKALIRFDAPVTYASGSRANYYGEIGAHSFGEGSSAETYTYPWRECFIVYAKKHQGDFQGWSNGESFWEIDDTEKECIMVKSDERFNGWSPAKVNTSTIPYTYDFIDHHWPAGYKLSFSAYSPANLEIKDYDEDNISYGATGLNIKNFQVQPTSAKQYDLLFSERTCNHTGYTSTPSTQAGISYYNGVPIKFQHALSSIHFSLKNSSGKYVKLKNIELYGVKFKGHFYEGITENVSDYSEYVRKTDENNSGNVSPRWSFKQLDDDGNETGEELANNCLSSNDAYVAFNGSGIVFPSTAEHVSSIYGKYVATQEGSGATVDKSKEYAYALLLLPQELTDDVKIEVTYTVANSSADSKPEEFTKTYQLNEYYSMMDANNPSRVDSWEIGTRYTYQLLYSDESVADDLIYFAPQTDEWKDVSPIVITL